MGRFNMDVVKEMPVQNRGQIRMLKMIIMKVAKTIGLKQLLLKVGDMAVQGTRSETDDKVWEKAKEFIKQL